MNYITIRRILVPVNFTDRSANALVLAAAMARRHGAVLRLLHVVNPENFAFPTGEGLAVSLPREDVLTAQTQRLQQWAAEILPNHPVPYSLSCRIGSVADSISEVAQDSSADLIVMGVHPSSGLLGYVTGSQAYRTLKRAPCPVLTVPDEVTEIDFKRILFPVRPVLGALDKYAYARTIVHRNNAHLTVLGLPYQEEANTRETVDRTMAVLNQRLTSDEIERDTLVAETDFVARTVARQAEEQRADLIIGTADIDTDIRHLLSGPYIKQLISRAKVPVLAVRPQVVEEEFIGRSEEVLIPTLPTFRPYYLSL